MATTDMPPSTSVTSPSTAVTVDLVVSGIRLPRAIPMRDPTTTVMTLTTVPAPMNTPAIQPDGAG